MNGKFLTKSLRGFFTRYNLILVESTSFLLNDSRESKGASVFAFVKISRKENDLEGEYVGDDIKVDFAKIQWVPQKNSHKLKILIPKQLFIDEKFNEDSLEELEVYTEPHYLELKDGSEIQFVRFGYCRKDSANQAIYTHK